MTAFALVVDVLAAYRLTRLLTADLVGGALVRWPITRWLYLTRVGMDADAVGPKGPQLDDMVDADLEQAAAMRGHGQGEAELPPALAVTLRCRWCAGFYIGAAVAAARWGVPDVWQWCAYGLALACAGPLLARFED